MQSALTQYRVPPDDTAATEAVRRRAGHAQHQGSNCSRAARRSLDQVLAQKAAAAQAAAQAEAAAANGAPAAPPTEGAAGTPGTVAADTSLERVGGRVRLHDLLDGLDVRAVRR